MRADPCRLGRNLDVEKNRTLMAAMAYVCTGGDAQALKLSLVCFPFFLFSLLALTFPPSFLTLLSSFHPLNSFSSLHIYNTCNESHSLYHRLTQPQHIHLCHSTPLRRTLFTDHYLHIHYSQHWGRPLTRVITYEEFKPHWNSPLYLFRSRRKSKHIPRIGICNPGFWHSNSLSYAVSVPKENEIPRYKSCVI